MENLLQKFNTIYPVSDHLERLLKNELTTMHIPRNDYLVQTGQICQNVYFIETGLLRGHEAKSNDHSTRFFREGDICLVPESYFMQVPSVESIIAVEDVSTYYLPRTVVNEIRKQVLGFNVILYELLIKDYLFLDQFVKAMRRRSALERYKWALENREWLHQRVPLKYIATYLGMSDVSMSLIRTKR